MPKINVQENPDDLEAVTLAYFGLYSRSIGHRVGMSACRAQYRVWREGGSAERRAWREGTSRTFQDVMRVVAKDVRDDVKRHVAQLELERARLRKAKVKAKAVKGGQK